MGLRASVYRPADGMDSTAKGVSSRYENLIVMNVPGPFEPAPDAAAVILIPGSVPGIAILVPAVRDDDGTWIEARFPGMSRMMGGNFASACDSRFGEAIEKIVGRRFYGAVPIHDRFETAEQSARLSV